MIGTKGKQKTLEIKLSGGVDLTSDICDVANNRASYMKNLISDGVGSKKRYGVHQIYKFADKNDAPSTVFQLGGILYIIGCGGLYIFDGEGIKGAAPYIPITYHGYDIVHNADTKHEGVNLISPSAVAIYCGKKYSENGIATFKFPENISDTHDVTVTVSISNITNQLYSYIGDEPNPDSDTLISHPITAVFKLCPKESWHGHSKSCENTTVNGKPFYILDSQAITGHIVTPKIQLNTSGQTFSFNFDTTTEIAEDFSIRVDYTVRDRDLRSAEACTFGEIIQDNRGQSRLALSGNVNCPSKVFFSDVITEDGSVYFPEECATNVDDDTPVTAFMKLSDSYLGVFKKNRFFRYAFSNFPEADTPKERHVIRGYEGRDTVGCINSRVCGRQGGDLLIFDGNGVYGIDNVSAETDREFLAERSRNIRRGLLSHTKEELLTSVACMHGGKYYLFIGGRVYIADMCRSFLDKSLSPHRQYEWWIWEGISAICASVINGKIYIGDTDGGISVIGDDFRDIRIHKIAASGDAVYSESDGLFTLNPSMMTDAPFFVRLSGECTFLENGEFSAFIHTSFGKMRTVILASVGTSRVKPGDFLKLIKTNGEAVNCRYTLYEDDTDLGIFSLADEAGELMQISPEEIHSVRIVDNGTREYTLKRFGNRFATYEGDEAVGWFNLPAIVPMSVYTYSFVECVYASPIIDFGEPLQPKSLFKIGIRADTGANGSIIFGYATDKTQRILDIKRGGFDLSRLDFNSISFALPFGQPYERRAFERRFLSSLFFCKSSDAAELCIRGIYATYAKWS